MYSTFYAPPCPVILCEGETDNIYLTHAIRSLASEFPALAAVVGDKIQLKVRLYKYPRSSTARVLGLNDGGAGVLATFISQYRQRLSKFTAPGLQHAVVVVYDNDEGAKSIRGAMRAIAKTGADGYGPYVRLHKNLYAVPVQLLGAGGTCCIEDCFDAPTKAAIVAGKTFGREKDFDASKHYGKKVFAQKVVQPNAYKIDFTGFRETLRGIESAIVAHQASITTDEPS